MTQILTLDTPEEHLAESYARVRHYNLRRCFEFQHIIERYNWVYRGPRNFDGARRIYPNRRPPCTLDYVRQMSFSRVEQSVKKPAPSFWSTGSV
jgi:hypothetical protein